MEEDKANLLFNKIILIAVASISGLMILMGFIGETTILGWQINYAFISCVLLCTIVIHLYNLTYGSYSQKKIEKTITNNISIVNQSIFEIENKIENSSKRVIESLSGVEKQIFKTIKDVDNYVADRIKNAKFSVLDLNWQDFRNTVVDHQSQHRNEIDDEIDESIKAFCSRKRTDKKILDKTIYEEIFTFPETNSLNLIKMKRHCTFGDIYTCSYFETRNTPKFPKIQFVIIDEEEVIFVSSEYKENFCSIKDYRIVNICLNYFMQARALSSDKIIKRKNGQVNNDIVKLIEDKYSKG